MALPTLITSWSYSLCAGGIEAKDNCKLVPPAIGPYKGLTLFTVASGGVSTSNSKIACLFWFPTRVSTTSSIPGAETSGVRIRSFVRSLLELVIWLGFSCTPPIRVKVRVRVS